MHERKLNIQPNAPSLLLPVSSVKKRRRVYFRELNYSTLNVRLKNLCSAVIYS